MKSKADRHVCQICGEPNQKSQFICHACEAAFGGIEQADSRAEEVDLARYSGKMFPWEPCELPPVLISGRWFALILCCSLILIVVILALLRTPIPTCWEVG